MILNTVMSHRHVFLSSPIMSAHDSAAFQFPNVLAPDTIYSTLTSISPASSGNPNLSIAFIVGRVKVSLLDMTWHSAISGDVHALLSFTRDNAPHRHFANHVCLYGFCLGFPGTYGYNVFVREKTAKKDKLTANSQFIL